MCAGLLQFNYSAGPSFLSVSFVPAALKQANLRTALRSPCQEPRRCLIGPKRVGPMRAPSTAPHRVPLSFMLCTAAAPFLTPDGGAVVSSQTATVQVAVYDANDAILYSFSKENPRTEIGHTAGNLEAPPGPSIVADANLSVRVDSSAPPAKPAAALACACFAALRCARPTAQLGGSGFACVGRRQCMVGGAVVMSGDGSPAAHSCRVFSFRQSRCT